MSSLLSAIKSLLATSDVPISDFILKEERPLSYRVPTGYLPMDGTFVTREEILRVIVELKKVLLDGKPTSISDEMWMNAVLCGDSRCPEAGDGFIEMSDGAWDTSAEFVMGDANERVVRRARMIIYYYGAQKKLAISMRVHNPKILKLDQLGLPEQLIEVAQEPSGIFFVTGPTGSGKTCTLTAVIDWINNNQRRHIVTVEDPIEYLHSDSVGVVTQRECGVDVDGFNAALRQALRQAPDVIMIGEVRDKETAEAAAKAAQTGHLVLVTMHTVNAVETIQRFLDLLESPHAGSTLSGVYQGSITQARLPTYDGKKSVVAYEFVRASNAIRNKIRDNNLAGLKGDVEQGRLNGNRLLHQTLGKLVDDGLITIETAEKACYDSQCLKDLRTELGIED